MNANTPEQILAPYPNLAREFRSLQANTYINTEARDLITRYLLYAAHHKISSLAHFPRRSPRHIARFLSAIANDFRLQMAQPMTRRQILQKLNDFCTRPENPIEPVDTLKAQPATLRAQLNAAIRYTPGITRTTKHRGLKLFAFTDRSALLKHLLDYDQHHPDATFIPCPEASSPETAARQNTSITGSAA